MATTGKVLLKVLFLAMYVVGCTLVEGCVHQVSQWYNNSHPNSVNRSEIESPPKAAVLDNLCPPSGNGTLGIECRDNVASSGPSQYGCDVNFGALCHAPASSTTVCPDVAIRYTCNCPTPQAAQTPPGSQPRTQSTPRSLFMTSPSASNGVGRVSASTYTGFWLTALWYLLRPGSDL